MHLFLLLSLVACDGIEDPDWSTCDITVAMTPRTGVPGDSVLLVGWPLTEAYDSAIVVDGSRATVLEARASSVTDCDECRAENACSLCGECFACGSACEGTIAFELPEHEPGVAPVVLSNSWGQSAPLPFTVLAEEPGDDTGTDPDTGDNGGDGS